MFVSLYFYKSQRSEVHTVEPNKTQRLKETRKEDTKLIFKLRSKSLAEIYFIHKRQEAMYNGVMMKMEWRHT